MHHDRTKHVASKIHFIRDIVDFVLVKIHKIHTTLNTTDMFTKCLPGNDSRSASQRSKSPPERSRMYSEMNFLFGLSHHKEYIEKEESIWLVFVFG